MDSLETLKYEVSTEMSIRDSKLHEVVEAMRQMKSDLTKFRADIELTHQFDFARVHSQLKGMSANVTLN